jgi:glucoamylase
MISTENSVAFGAPGSEPRWTSSAKSGVGTALSSKSRVWFTLSHGVFNEIYYPGIDHACVRDMEFIVTDGADFFSEEKRGTVSEIHCEPDAAPAFHVINTCRESRYRIEKEIVSDPQRDTVLQRVHFTAQNGAMSDYHLNILLAPHLGNQGRGNTAWVGEFEGAPMLFAQRNGTSLALASSSAWKKRSVGYVGSSDGWQDLKKHKQMTWEFTRAENGNVALTAEIDLNASKGEFVLALGFGSNPDEAGRNAAGSLRDGFDKAKNDYLTGWREWMKSHTSKNASGPIPGDLSQVSLVVLRTHESKAAPGGVIASLSIPWGFSKGDNDLGGYHLVWSRDLVEAAGGFLAAGAADDAYRVISFLRKTQQPDGHWSQNMWLDGSPYWTGIQMDETALLVAADMADENHEASIGTYLREAADVWNSSIERWMYVSGTYWSKKYDVDGYYVRIAPVDKAIGPSLSQETVHVKNVSTSEDVRLAGLLVSPGALALVRFGVRAADDRRIRDTVGIIDDILKVQTPVGDTWHRYNDDGYGEHKEGQLVRDHQSGATTGNDRWRWTSHCSAADGH